MHIPSIIWMCKYLLQWHQSCLSTWSWTSGRIAAAISSQSYIIPPKCLWRPSWMALMRGRQTLVEAFRVSVVAGRSLEAAIPCVFTSDWRMVKSFITVQYSSKNAISAGLSLYDIKHTLMLFSHLKIALLFSTLIRNYSKWETYVKWNIYSTV